LLHRHGQEGITIQYSRLPFSCYDGSRSRKADIPALTGLQTEALNSLQTIATKHAFPVPTKPGDILYFNNVGLFHGRERYIDHGTSDTLPEDMDRHVLRLWLQDLKRTEPLAPPLQKIWDEIYGSNTANGRDETWGVKAIAAFAMNADKNG
jgi:Taurine catabolism dioxygenase TauD, TfdA family